MSGLVAIILLFFVVVPIGQAVARAIEARASRPQLPETSAHTDRLDELDGQVRHLTERVEAIQENQEFLTRLLEGRPTGALNAQSEEERR